MRSALSLPWDPDKGGLEFCGGAMPVGEEPCEKITETVIGKLRIHLQMTEADHVEEGLVKLKTQYNGEVSQYQSELNDGWAPFDHMPGTRGGHVSIPSKEFKTNYDEAHS